MKTAIVNLGTIVSGDWRDPFVKGDSIVMASGKIVSVGSTPDVTDCDVVIDADGATAVPGFIDSQVHNTFGDWTPRQKTVGFLESYTHGGTTTAISASEAMKSATTNLRTRLVRLEPRAIFCPPAETSLPSLSGRNNMVCSSCLAFCPLGTTSRNLNFAHTIKNRKSE